MTTHRTLDLDTLTLGEGLHPQAGGYCLLEAVAYIAGEPWSDSPVCVSPVLAAYGRAWNDGMRSDKERESLKHAQGWGTEWALAYVG